MRHAPYWKTTASDCSMIATKAPVYAVERIEALQKAGFSLSEEPLVGEHRQYYDYWIK